jgi:hypothetical protein
MSRELMMRRLLFSLVAGALLLGGGAADARWGGGDMHGGSTSFSSSELLSSTPHGESSALSPVSPLPSRAPLYSMARPSFSEGQIGAAPNLGPVTGYGPGGLSHSPGTPANPPY